MMRPLDISTSAGLLELTEDSESVSGRNDLIERDRMLSFATRSPHSTLRRRTLRTLARATMKVIPVPVRSDNYAYLLVDERSKKAAAVDPYDVPKVVLSAQGLGVEIVACIITHHHDDHCGGNHVGKFADFLRRFFNAFC